MKNWIYQKGDNAIRVISDDPEAVNNEDVVLYVDDVNPEVIEEVVNLYNAGKDTTEIDAYLLDEEKCTQDEREFIMENIVNYINFIEKMEEQQIVPPVAEEIQMPKVMVMPQVIANIIPGFATEPGSPAPVERQKRAWVRKTTDTKAPVKMQSTEDFIKVMQEKIEMARMLDSVELPELPGSMTKANRDVMVEFQKEHAAMIVKYMQKIQQA